MCDKCVEINDCGCKKKRKVFICDKHKHHVPEPKRNHHHGPCDCCCPVVDLFLMSITPDEEQDGILAYTFNYKVISNCCDNEDIIIRVFNGVSEMGDEEQLPLHEERIEYFENDFGTFEFTSSEVLTMFIFEVVRLYGCDQEKICSRTPKLFIPSGMGGGGDDHNFPSVP